MSNLNESIILVYTVNWFQIPSQMFNVFQSFVDNVELISDAIAENSAFLVIVLLFHRKINKLVHKSSNKTLGNEN